MQTLQVPVPDDGPATISAALKAGETVAEFLRAAINRELKSRKSPPLSSVSKRGRPARTRSE